VAACTAIAFINELVTLSVFSWLALLSVYACWTVTVACREHILTLYRQGAAEYNFGQALKEEIEAMQKGKLNERGHFMEYLRLLWEKATSKRESADSAGAREVMKAFQILYFSRMEISPWASTMLAYCPPVILASISLASIPDHGDLSDVEMDDGTVFDIPGLDRFCSAGLRSNMFWYLLAYVSLTFLAALFFHYKGRQMVKIIEGRHLGSTQSIDRWLADKKSGKKARTDTAHTYFLEQSKLQTQLLFFSWGFQSFKAVYIWGAIVPSATMAYLTSTTILYHNVLSKPRFQAWIRSSVGFISSKTTLKMTEKKG